MVQFYDYGENTYFAAKKKKKSLITCKVNPFMLLVDAK